MPIKIGQAFERTSAEPIDSSIALTKAQMLAVNDNLMPAYYFTICQDDGKIYLYDKTATASATTGKFKEFSGGSGGSEVFSTTETLSDEINDTTTVLAADLPGVSFSDITVGITLIRDDKGTVGLVTAKNGTTDVTVTTATTSTPTKELTQAEYDALTEAEKNNGTIYFITDNYVGSTYVGAYDTIYSTTERVVGSYMGKPLYQKTLVQVLPTIESTGTQVVFSGVPTDIDMLIDAEGTGHYRSPYVHCGLANQWISNYSSINTNVIVPDTTDGNFVIQLRSSNAALSGQTYYITIRYTKTTDTTSPVEYASPNDYSTSEKIVGTWIDGKPIYQKTVNCGTSIGVINHNIANIDKVVDASGVGFDATGGGYNIPFAGDNWIQCYGTRTRIDLQSKASGWNLSGGIYITLKYTKTS